MSGASPALLAGVRGQPTAVETLRRGLAAGRVHHAYLFDGPNGVGKERAAFGLAQALVCERRSQGSADACGECRACARAVPRPGEGTPLHPDVVVLERGLYDPAAIGRRSPETQDISIDQVRTLVLARAAFSPHEGRAKVFVVRRAEELSLPAANALLKTLEEPGARTHFVLLTAVADSLLPTILSRVQRIRFGALPDDVVAALLVERGTDAAQATELARLAGGSMAMALVLADPEASARREEFVSRALGALEATDIGAALELAEEAKKVARDVLLVQMETLAVALAARARAGPSERAADVAAARHSIALAAMQQVDANASAQLAVEAMLLKMRDA
ncbi:MAG TPA: DNA polymerase III subunit [Polyangiaceae bacterium]|nr:DNA polymerase III subunit [Polyangiaceae bacterium]